jgi:hypothetical protein
MKPKTTKGPAGKTRKNRTQVRKVPRPPQDTVRDVEVTERQAGYIKGGIPKRPGSGGDVV